MTAPALIDRFDQARALLDAEWLEWETSAQAPPVVEVYDKDWQFVSYADAALDGDAEWIKNDAGEANVAWLGDHPVGRWMADEVAEAEDVHLRIVQDGNVWTGKGQVIEDAMLESGVETVTFEGLHDYQHAKKVYCYPNPWAPITLQWPKIYIYYGPAITGIKQLLLVNLMRRYQHGWAPAPDMFSTFSYRNLQPDRWAQIVNPLGAGLLHDTSMHTVIVTRMGQFHEIVKPILEDAGLMLTAERWLPGDPQPFPDHAILRMPTLIWDVVDTSGVRGPTGTLVDGFIGLVRSIASDGITETTQAIPWEEPVEYSQPDFWGTVTRKPAVVFYRQQRWTGAEGSGQVGVRSIKRRVHKALGHAIITGGRSPGWVNSGIKMLVNAALGWIGMIFLNPGLTLGLLDDQVEDVVLAFARWDFDAREALMGRDAYGDVWEPSGGTGFSLSTVGAIRTGKQATQPYTSFQVEVVNAMPYMIGRHFDIASPISAEVGRSGRLYTDELRRKKLSFGPRGIGWDLAIGVDSEERTPIARLGRLLESTKQIVQNLSVQS
ncbi:hypothetical protein K3888_13320 [Dietzia aurantiaca]|uniref:Gp37-like protein n=1 Tax=Dietzia aurantiaca TaxID=983873 RepID=UPI001E317F60|nr:hypothetical protein [Dietzia aurantiaca]MCD2263680.1 hypothetical protein [Dietzia aurantiaca]